MDIPFVPTPQLTCDAITWGKEIHFYISGSNMKRSCQKCNLFKNKEFAAGS
ncbi:hypothetical protein yberc0001_16420 [Yersinia bercovieri ATCC 43970]|uniref:Uncharacterized protein n=1 Tax=Yersinia bercovieri ATCC 43970 TaxID=349968 RepID=A0ABP2E697_YERBE|nr:hypothetical protein yberc0001_16420 [Yersinia bercovieri ATCC 43970]